MPIEIPILVLLRRWRAGDAAAYDLLVERTYRRLLAIASTLGARDRGDDAPGELVNEAYLRLRQLRRIDWQNRDHFFSFAATEIRRVLIARARERLAQKRGGGQERVVLDANVAWIELPPTQILDLNRALEELKEKEPADAQPVARFFSLNGLPRQNDSFRVASPSRPPAFP